MTRFFRELLLVAMAVIAAGALACFQLQREAEELAVPGDAKWETVGEVLSCGSSDSALELVSLINRGEMGPGEAMEAVGATGASCTESRLRFKDVHEEEAVPAARGNGTFKIFKLDSVNSYLSEDGSWKHWGPGDLYVVIFIRGSVI